MSNSKSMEKIKLSVNGEIHEVLISTSTVLSDVLREQLNLIGTKVACGMGECGACTVLIDGVPTYACITLAMSVRNREITTIEGMADGKLDPIQQGLLQEGGFQCGFCTPGKVMAAKAIFNEYDKEEITRDLVTHELSGHLCRCTGYVKTVDGVLRAAGHEITHEGARTVTLCPDDFPVESKPEGGNRDV